MKIEPKTPVATRLTPGQMVYEFCKSAGICTTCKINWCEVDNLKCGYCAEKNRRYSRESKRRSAVGKSHSDYLNFQKLSGSK